LFVVSNKAEEDAETDAGLVIADCAAKLKPLSGREFDLNANVLSDVNAPFGIDEASTEAYVFNAAFVSAGHAIPPGGQVC
jgi:hypothetical protein